MESLQEREWRSLIRMIQNDDCILLLGPDMALDPNGCGNTTLTIKLAQILAEELKHKYEPSCEENLAHIAQIYERKNDRISLEIAAEDFYRNYAGQTTETHRHLASLPISLCIDLTPTGLMAKAYEEAGKNPIREFYDFKGQVNKPLARGVHGFDKDKCPLIYELFGSLDNSASLLLTENDLLDFLVNVAKKTPPLPQELTSRFTDQRTSFLFLGFGFHHWYLRILLHVLKADSDRQQNLSLALEDAAFFSHPDQHQTVLFYSEQHRIQFRRASWQMFAEELRERFCNEPPKVTEKSKPSTLSINVPRVFLCHCSEDAEAVGVISAKLQELGVQTWLDRQNLRGGDHWDRLITKVINEWVDYFVVLETPSMLKGVEKYYYKEIAYAVERNKNFGRGAKFIFPAQLMDCDRLTETADYQRIDLKAPNGIQQLVQDILDDWTLRSST